MLNYYIKKLGSKCVFNSFKGLHIKKILLNKEILEWNCWKEEDINSPELDNILVDKRNLYSKN